MASDMIIGHGVDIDDSVKLGKGVVLRDYVNLKYCIVEDGVKIGRNTFIFGTKDNPVRIGKDSYISPNCYFNGAAGLVLENEVVVAAGVMIFTDSGPNVGPLRKYYKTVAKQISIGRGCWIGAGSVLLPGANMAPEAVLAANSTLKAEVGFHQVYGGNLAKLIKEIDVQK